ncbi:cation diffusion facilitator family transporter [Marinimicrobium sp. C6131]|uniref:cation diffusion facilitator family transporter n=1 Tax=Marinimicrobium sp. C6131 TaxID=3022676 RepID=UPI00223D2FEB|nr:cation diffusion facilitator family transporter [Marinimicrobium sp. C6131]UZJ44404.1 cation diffusion facilitator family transporter [Marinimicrobium sp. C6131]
MHDHSHNHGNEGTRIGWAFFLNVGFTIIEFIGGVLTNSTAIMADAVHDLGDSLSIGFSWLLARLSGKQANASFTYGYRRFSLLGSFINALVLIVGSVWILSEAIPRLDNPPMPMAGGMLGLAVFGVFVNGFAAYKLSKGKTLNERVLNWHLLEDVLGWVAVLVVAIILMFVDWPILDPLLSIGFTLFILFNVGRNFWQTVRLFLQASPSPELKQALEETLRSLTGVNDVHHLHLWSLDGEHHVLSVHIRTSKMTNIENQKKLKKAISRALTDYELAHTTVELEFDTEECRDG